MLQRNLIWVALLALALYAVSVPGDFVYDDVAVVLKDERIANVSRWGAFWAESYNGGVDNLYRPIVSMTYALQYQVHGDLAWPYHLVNVILHAIASAMVTWVATKLATRCGTSHADRVGLISGLLFAAHPIHVEAVANIVGRAEAMCAIGVLGAIGMVMSPLTRGRVFAIWGLVVFSILCKEQGMLAPLMLGAVALCGKGGWSAKPLAALRDRRGHASLLFALLMLTVAMNVFVRENVLNLKFWWDRAFLDSWIQPLIDSAGVDRWLAPVTIVGRYTQLLVAPVTLRIDYGGVIVPGVVQTGDPYFWLGWIGLIACVGLLAWGIVRRDGFVLATLLCFAIVYSLISNWLTLIGVNVAERLMYLPSAFFLMLIARLVANWRRGALVGAGAVVLIAMSVRTVTYAVRWNDMKSFYEYTVRVEPRSMKGLMLCLEAFSADGDYARAEHYGRLATQVLPTYADAWLRLSAVYVSERKFDEAAAAIARAREIDRSNPVSIANRIGIYERKMIEARELWQTVEDAKKASTQPEGASAGAPTSGPTTMPTMPQ